jgi:hypothetical protein
MLIGYVLASSFAPFAQGATRRRPSPLTRQTPIVRKAGLIRVMDIVFRLLREPGAETQEYDGSGGYYGTMGQAH